MNRIDGKIAVVTGSSQGLGAAIAQQFARAGAAGLVLIGRGTKKGQLVAQNIELETKVPTIMVTADLKDLSDVRRVIPAADTKFGRVDILVNAAGMTERGNLLNTTPELFNRMFAVNVRAPFFLMQDAVNIMERECCEGAYCKYWVHVRIDRPTFYSALLRLQICSRHTNPKLWLRTHAQPYTCEPT